MFSYSILGKNCEKRNKFDFEKETVPDYSKYYVDKLNGQVVIRSSEATL